MADFPVLPYGNYSGQVQQLLNQLPPARAAAPYGTGPAIGSPEYQADLQRLSRRAPAQLGEEELNQLRWGPWSEAQGFNHQPDRVQREMVSQYYNNILPYVASGTGEQAETYQSMFHAQYPNVARMLGQPDPVQTRRSQGEEFGLSGDALARYALTDSIPANTATTDPYNGRRAALDGLRGPDGIIPGMTVEDEARFILSGQAPAAARSGTASAATPDSRRAELAAMRAEQGEAYTLTPEQESSYILTGRYTAVPASQRNREAAAANEATSQVRNAEMSVRQATDALRQADQILGVLGFELDDAGQVTGDGRGMFSMPASGRLATMVSQNPYNPITFDANRVHAYLQTLRASSVFNSLQALREASVDGSSGLGQVTNVEINLLASRVAALAQQDLSDEDLANEVAYIRSEIARYMAAAEETIAAHRRGEQVFIEGYVPTVADGAQPVGGAQPAGVEEVIDFEFTPEELEIFNQMEVQQ